LQLWLLHDACYMCPTRAYARTWPWPWPWPWLERESRKKIFLRELRHKGDCYCFKWAVYAPWACCVLYRHIKRALYIYTTHKHIHIHHRSRSRSSIITKPPKCALTCQGQGDLAADLAVAVLVMLAVAVAGEVAVAAGGEMCRQSRMLRHLTPHTAD
jgi:hypothetical protein